MPHYKDLQNNLHFIEDSIFENLLPTGSVKITDIEADNLRKPPPPTKEQINAGTFTRLALIDLKSIRPLREGDKITLATLDAQAGVERAKILK